MDRPIASYPHSEDIDALLASVEQRLASAGASGEEAELIVQIQQILAEIRAALRRGDGGN